MKGVFITAGCSLLALTLIGCSSKDSQSANTGGPRGGPMAMMQPTVEPGPFYEGRLVFAKDCNRCHSINGKRMASGRGNRGFRGGPPVEFRGGPPGGGPGMGPMARGPGGARGGRRGGGGPDLGKVGAKHPREWIVSHIRDPQQDKADSRMPKFGEEKINKKDMDALADYLVSLKGKKSETPKTEGAPPQVKPEAHSQGN